MYLICTYDVSSTRCNKYMKIFRKYLFHVQNSVFEGELTPAQYKRLSTEINKIIKDEDHVIIYFSYNRRQILKTEIGKIENKTSIIID